MAKDLFNKYIWLVDTIYRAKRITFEEIPSGRQFLTTIIEAVRDNLTLEITYQSYWRDEPSVF